ncbi:MAG: ATP-binding protein [Alphaproteobacteria bacterium]|nr:ATP-binding protein [Alphaproteobacteria bacterium]
MKKAVEHLIGRPTYIAQLQKWRSQQDLIKIITGVRRCGKSKLFSLYQMDLEIESHNKKQKINIININLEDLMKTREIGLEYDKEGFLTDYNKLLDYVVARLKPQIMNYVFLDEIQLLRDWQRVANTLRLHENVDVYLTGSNAYMFSSDLANTLGGRYVEIKMQPLSFKEYYSDYTMRAPIHALTIKEMEDTRNPLGVYSHYIKKSGFPQTLDFLYDRQLINDYLMDTVYRNTIQKDIVRRFKISDTNKLDAVVRYLFDNIGNETSVRNIEKGLKAGGFSVSVPTISTYIQGLIDSYLMYKCDRYDIKGKQLLENSAKYYVADIGLRTALLGHEDMDQGHILENVVYLELLRRGYQVSVGKINKGGKNIEVDFVAQKSVGEVEYYQVALYALEPEVLKRELAPLEEIEDNYPKFLLSMDYGSGNTKGIKRLNVLEWLLELE